MSAATVRVAVRDYLDTAAIAGVQRVYKAPPWWIDGGTFNLSGQLGWGAIIAVNIDHQSEQRIALPAKTGKKIRRHEIGLLVIMQWLVPNPLPAGEHEDAWVTASDQLLDDIVTQIEADPNLGHPDVIWQAGQEGDQIEIDRDVPKRDPSGGAIHIWHLIKFQAAEIITA